MLQGGEFAGTGVTAMWVVLWVLGCAEGGRPTLPAVSATPELPPPEPSPAVLPAPTEARYAASHVWIRWKGAEGVTHSIARTEAEARELATDLHRQAMAGAPIETLAKTHSDGPSGPRGGTLGVYRTGTMLSDFEAAVASVDVGRVAPLIRTPYGFHVARRDAVREIRVRHVLVPFAGAWRTEATRSEQAAHQRAEQALASLDAGTDFADVARTYGEDATAPLGGDLGRIAPGQLVPDFEDAAFALDVGERAVVRTPYGVHVVERTE